MAKSQFFTNTTYPIILFVIFIASLFSLDNYHNWSGDYSLYLNEANSLLNGSLNNLSVQNRIMMDNGHVGPYLYPIGYPIIISPIIKLTNSLFFIKLFNSLFLIIIVITLEKIYKVYLKQKIARCISILFITSNFIFYNTNRIESDIFGLMLFLLSFYYLNKAFNEKVAYVYFFIFFSTYCILTRTAYMSVFAGIIIYFLFLKRHPSKAKFSIIIPFLIYFVLTTFTNIGNGEYEIKKILMTINDFSTLASTVKSNLIYYAKIFSLNLVNKKLFIFISLNILSTFLIYTQYRRLVLTYVLNIPLISVLFFSNLILFLIWPWQEGSRFVWLNIIILFGVLAYLIDRYLPNLKLPIYIATFTLISIKPITERLYLNFRYNKSISIKDHENLDLVGSENFKKMIQYIKSNTQTSDIILCRDPRTIHYFSHRISFLLNDSNLHKGKYIVTYRNPLHKENILKLKSFGVIDIYEILQKKNN